MKRLWGGNGKANQTTTGPWLATCVINSHMRRPLQGKDTRVSASLMFLQYEEFCSHLREPVSTDLCLRRLLLALRQQVFSFTLSHLEIYEPIKNDCAKNLAQRSFTVTT